MGVDLRPQLNEFLSKQTVPVTERAKIIRATLRQFWGTWELRYWLLTDAEPNNRQSRPRLSKKDPVGFAIFRCKLGIDL